MATTIPNIKAPAAWLEIGLSCQRLGHYLGLTITFTNTYNTNQELVFSNQARKAELLGLLVFNEESKRIMPVHNLIVKPVDSALEKHVLAPGAAFSYQLAGTMTKDGLVFPGAIFALNPEENYHLRFRYAGKESNAVPLNASHNLLIG